MSVYNSIEIAESEILNLKVENELLKNINKTIEEKSYNQAIDDAADLLNCVDLPRDELAAAVRKLKKVNK